VRHGLAGKLLALFSVLARSSFLRRLENVAIAPLFFSNLRRKLRKIPSRACSCPPNPTGALFNRELVFRIKVVKSNKCYTEAARMCRFRH
jgi:hypothetical protein